MASIRLSFKEIRKLQLLNCLKMLVKQDLISSAKIDERLEKMDLLTNQYILPIDNRASIIGLPDSMITKEPAVFITFLSSQNIINQSSGDALLKATNQHETYQPALHVWILDRAQKTANSLRVFFRVDKSGKKVDNISGGQIERTRRAMDQRILIFTWYTFHGNYFDHYHSPEIISVIRYETIDPEDPPSSKQHRILTIHDYLSMLLNLRCGDIVISSRYSEMTGKAIVSHLVK